MKYIIRVSSCIISIGKAGVNKFALNDGLLTTTSNEYLGTLKRRYRIILEFNVMTNINMRDVSYARSTLTFLSIYDTQAIHPNTEGGV